MSALPIISIIIPAYNCVRWLPTTLDSVLAQTVCEWECLVVDDGSTDDTSRVAQEYADRDMRFQVIRQPNSGPSAARNHGLRASSPASRYLTFMDSDDVWLPDALTVLQQELERHPERVGSHGLADFIDADGNPQSPGQHADFGRKRFGYDGRGYVWWGLEKPTSFACLSQGNVCFPPGLVLARRVAYEQAGPFDDSFRGPEDWDMLIRLSRFGDFTFVNRVILQYRRHESNLGAQNGIAQAAWRVRCKAFFSPDNTPEQQRIVRGGWRAYQRFMIGERIKAAQECLKSRRFAGALSALVRIPVHYGRYLRGYPK